MSTSKKPKLSDEFEAVKQYLLACTVVPKEHPAIQAALHGMDQEIKRQERDWKLRQKFTREREEPVTIEKINLPPVDAAAPNLSSSAATTKASGGRVKRGSPTMIGALPDDWHDVSEDQHDSPLKDYTSNEETDVTGLSFLGKQLAKDAVSLMALHQTKTRSPVAAIALGLHAAMLSDPLVFVCTGVPELSPSTVISKGFAAPIRELSQDQFLPTDWDKSEKLVLLRYRKQSTGSLILRVEKLSSEGSLKDVTIEISLYPTSTPEPPSSSLIFSLADHLNIDSWSRALRQESSVAPALHYKALGTLLSRFAHTFDLGSVGDDASELNMPYVDTTIRQQQQQPQNFRIAGESRLDPPARPAYVDNQPWDHDRTPTIEDSFPGNYSRRGDFSGDLMPGGITGPNFGRIDPSQGGSLMGPNHPVFNGGIGGVGPNSGFGMRPRFDPFGPPGGPTDPEQGVPDGQQRRRPGGSGNPNPDHLRPPNNLNNNMFM
jgi:hypothetical protein